MENMNREPVSWLEQFRLEGALRGSRENVAAVLDVRFPGAVSTELIEAIHRQTDIPLLMESLDLAATTQSPDEVLAFLQQAGK
jgi:hypothetical protein